MKSILIYTRIRRRTIILWSMMVFSIWLVVFAFQENIQSESSPLCPCGEVSVLIRLDERTLYLFADGQVVKQYPIAIGKSVTPSPIGEWQIVWKDAGWGEGFGTRWMGLDVPWGTFGIHGTNRPWTIGKKVSHGCIRMQNHDVEELYACLPIGTNVKVEGQIAVTMRELRPAMAGQAVVALQLRLRELGYLSGRADGRYGKAVEDAVKECQEVYGLAVTGIADRELLEKIGFRIVQQN